MPRLGRGLPEAQQLSRIFLMVTDTAYSQTAPEVLGKNVLKQLLLRCKETLGEQFLLMAGFIMPWYLDFRTTIISNRNFARNKNRGATLEKLLITTYMTVNVRVIQTE